ncbi:MAG: substrate-binding domain-containing protein [Haloplanus sp.]
MHETSGTTRRGFLLAAGATGAVGLAGCTGARTGAGSEAPADDGGSSTVTILAAGSLQHALKTGLAPAVDVPTRIEAHGSATVARLIAEGQRDPDIVTLADTALFEDPLSPPWYSVFAGNAVVLAYNSDTDGGQRVADADRWYDPLVDGDVRLGRTDPDRDPLGYRTLFTLELAARHYADAPALRETVPHRRQVYPETALIGGFETGSIDAAFAYRNMAIERGYDYVDLPDRIDLSDPAHADWYSSVSYTLPSGQKIRGGPISYGSTVRHRSGAALSVFAAHTTGNYLADAGFLARRGFPRYEGEVPAGVRQATTADGEGPALAGTISALTVRH